MRIFAPEVVQTSAMDCGPAALKSLLEGFGTDISYGRLREACQTEVDGTSIDTLEELANRLGLEAEQIMLPADHLLLPGANALPAIVVVSLPNGLTHFVVAWRRLGPWVQVMDPAIGRRWINADQFRTEVYQHAMAVDAAGWQEFASAPEFQAALIERLDQLGVSRSAAHNLTSEALSGGNWRSLAALDAAIRFVASLVRAGGVKRGSDANELIGRLCASPELVPVRYWSVQPTDTGEDGSEQVFMRGAVLVRARGKRAAPAFDALGPELSAAVSERAPSPGRELLRLVRESGAGAASILVLALLAGGGAVVLEALLFQALLKLGQVEAFHSSIIARYALPVLAAILVFSSALLLLEAPTFSGAMRIGRQIENRLRVAFLEKIPKLGDRYFQSRLTSDMAERSHASHRLRRLPDLARQLLRAAFELCATAAAIIWLLPDAAPWVLLATGAALLVPFAAQPVLAERDARARNHSAGLTRFYLDAMLGLLAIRAHRAERSVRKEHGKLVREWASAALRLQRAVVVSEAVQLAATFGFIVCLLLTHPLHGTEIGRILLIVYWALNLPMLGQEIGMLARQYPYARNLTLRLLEPLGAPEENVARAAGNILEPLLQAPRIHFRNVSVEASGHVILTDVNLTVDSGTHIAIVGPSGAGKSSLVGVLLGWLKPTSGEVLVDGSTPDLDQLRRSIAWVDPAIQLWNRSLLANLSYGSEADEAAATSVVDAASLRGVLESLPNGLQTPLGEGGGLVSGGEGQRVRLARAMLRKSSRLVILDEPFRGLDRQKRRELLVRVREYWRDATLLCITHDLTETQAFDRVVVVDGGHIIEDGAPQELASTPDSRYAQLLLAEQEMRSELWSSDIWRRVRIDSGQLFESDATPESEVA